MELSRKHQLVLHGDGLNLLGIKVNALKRNKKSQSYCCKGDGVEINVGYM
jgi:hypothetical protein